MKTLCIINQKGGVGKSTTAQAVGGILHQQGNKVLFIDLDAQGNTTATLRADGTEKNIYNALMRLNPIKENIVETESGGNIVPSYSMLVGLDAALNRTGKEYRLKEELSTLEGEYDYCIIDTPPMLGIATINALTASDYVLIPAQADIYSISGITQLEETIATVKQYCNPSLQVLGIVLTRYQKRGILTQELTNVAQEVAEKMHTVLFDTCIRECIKIKESQTMRQFITEYAPKSNASIDYIALVKELKKKGL